ncbi:ABC transporter permease [Nostoc flagelliforme FACHB-838]|uniref:ABC transporter permease n=1 Tax=Nostoc flagelliforme FACHB-838 TaxID=2692904 RepID=A0ABR8DYY6_9NOSO|nr:ABC transporter permease [Nostoc flagelliforme]MBD2534697.1 ABC transporter permease [Nostoc flagelliforme FACHB-838]
MKLPTAISNHQTLGRKLPLIFSNRRSRTLMLIALCAIILSILLLGTQLIGKAGLEISLQERNQPPTLAHPFGTDWLGRDMFTRTVHGLSLSLWVGLLTASFSAVIALLLGTLSATLGGKVDAFIIWIIDVFFSLPHLVLVILIAFALGGGVKGLIIAITITHWMNLARLLRAEVLQIKSSDYVQLSSKLGHSSLWIARNHILPHLVPQFLVGLILLFPHAILHEAGLTFLGLGLPPEIPAIGIILSESMRYLSTGYWWLAVMPGVALLLAVKSFDILGQSLLALFDPKTSQG